MWALAIFIATYIGVALGRIPGLMLDRNGIALLGAIAMVVSGAVLLDQAVASIDFPTILLLYALMIVSAQLRLGGFYTRTAQVMTVFCDRPKLFLLASMMASAVLSAVLANDIICLAFTPIMALALILARLNPIPFLLGLAAASNIGSAATIIGNPQNLLIGQVGHLEFGAFLAWCAPPSAAAFIGAYLIIIWRYAGQWQMDAGAEPDSPLPVWPEFNRWQSAKGVFVVMVLMVFFFTPIPREMTALAAAGVLLCSRKMKARHVVELVDWHLLTLFCALFIVIEGIALAGIPEKMMAMLTAGGIDIQRPFTLTVVSTLLSNLVSNVPATMLLVRFLDTAQPEQWYILALSSTFAGNLITIGSIANLIVIEKAAESDINIDFWTHAKVGVLVTIWSLAALIGWIYLVT
jgi:Na+/H+ antiporter NhaD/arsenite permease-like protein